MDTQQPQSPPPAQPPMPPGAQSPLSAADVAVVGKIKNAMKQAVVKGDFEIPALPHVAMEVLKLTNNPNVSMAQLEAIVKQDQSIAVRIVKMANSVMFPRATEITSLQQAMARIGLKNVKDVVVSIGIQSKAFQGSKYEDILKSIWENSIGTALITQDISKSLLVGQDSSFLAGLLATLGKPLLVQIVTKLEKNEMILARNEALTKKLQFDEKTFGIPRLKEEILPIAFQEFGSVVGGAVAARWNLPEHVVAAIKFQNKPTEAPAAQRKLVWMVYLAQLMCKNSGFGELATPVDFKSQTAIRELGLDEAELNEILQDCNDKIGPKIAAFSN